MIAKRAKIQTAELTRQFDVVLAEQIAEEATLFPQVKSNSKLEDVNLRTAEERELYALRVIGRVAHEHFKMSVSQVPQKPTTLVSEVADAIVIFAQ